jgi:hypothetical protein
MIKEMTPNALLMRGLDERYQLRFAKLINVLGVPVETLKAMQLAGIINTRFLESDTRTKEVVVASSLLKIAYALYLKSTIGEPGITWEDIAQSGSLNLQVNEALRREFLDTDFWRHIVERARQPENGGVDLEQYPTMRLD